MSYYELEAEGKGYSYFTRRRAVHTLAHFHGAYELVFIRDGEQEVLIGGERRVMRAGDACFVDAFCVHSFLPTEPTNCYVIVGNKESFDKIFSKYGENKPPRFFRFDGYELLDDLYGFWKKPYENQKNKRIVFEGAMRILLADVSERVDFSPSEDDGQGTLVCRILSFAEESFREDLSLGSLSRKFGYSREHLSRIIHKYLAENWNCYVGRLRARKVEEELLLDPHANVLDVALGCGFESANTFYRAYKKAFGRPPRQFLT